MKHTGETELSARRIPLPHERASRTEDARARVTGSDARRCDSGKWHEISLYKWRVGLEIEVVVGRESGSYAGFYNHVSPKCELVRGVTLEQLPRDLHVHFN